MGVAGLWQLLDPTGRPVRLETLEGKVLAIDISIWLNQLVKGYRASGGVSVDNAHLLGLFQRVCKLLHFKIKPVFVFDGEAPALKYQTLATRKRRREDGDEAIRAATKKMLQTYVQQKLLGEANAKLPKIKPSRRQQAEQDLFRLPEMPRTLSSSGDESSTSESAVDIARDADLTAIRIDSEEFKSLPLEMQHEFLVALKNREKKGAVDVDELPVDGNDFSTYQMGQLLKKNKLQARIEEMQREMSDGMLRMASDANVKVLLKVSPHRTGVEVKDEDEDDDVSPSKKAKLERLSIDEDGSVDAPLQEETKEKRVENFLVSQWLEGAQRGEESNETLKKAVELVRDEVDVISDSGASSDEVEQPPQTCEVRKRLLSTGGKVSAEEAMRQLEPQPPDGRASKEASLDSVLSDGLSMEVGHGSIISASTSRVMQPDEQFDEGSRGRPASDSDEEKAGDGVRAQSLVEDSTEQTCNTDMLNADLEVSETANSVFRMEEAAERSKSQEDDANTAQSSQSCKLTEVMGSPVIKEVSFLGGTQSSLNSNDDIVLPQNLSRYASKDPSRCNSNSLGFIPGALGGATGSGALADNPTDFHQALEIIREQERRQSECAADTRPAQCDPDSGKGSSLVANDESHDRRIADEVNEATGTGTLVADVGDEKTKSKGTNPEKNNNIEEKSVGGRVNDGGHSVGEPLSIAAKVDVVNVSATTAAETGRATLTNGTSDLPNGNGGDDNDDDVNIASMRKGEQNADGGDLLSKLSPEFIASQKQQLEAQSQALQNEINRIQRQTGEVTASMADDCAELLRLFGVPCVRAPREAEAQCAVLECVGLVQGVVTDDSDIFLFGGQTVYRNLFSQNTHCEMFTAKTIETRLKLSREDLIGFAMLTGSDYTNGIENVGPVTACEILAEFRGEGGKDVLRALRDFKEWWALAQRGAVPPKNSVRTRFIKLRLDDKFPSEMVFNAYDKPTVDSFKEKFSWTRPDLDLLRAFASRKFNWSQDKTDSYLLPLMKKYEDRTAQPRIDGFLLPEVQKRENLFPSKRLKAAVGKIRAAPQKEANLSESSSNESD